MLSTVTARECVGAGISFAEQVGTLCLDEQMKNPGTQIYGVLETYSTHHTLSYTADQS